MFFRILRAKTPLSAVSSAYTPCFFFTRGYAEHILVVQGPTLHLWWPFQASKRPPGRPGGKSRFWSKIMFFRLLRAETPLSAVSSAYNPCFFSLADTQNTFWWSRDPPCTSGGHFRPQNGHLGTQVGNPDFGQTSCFFFVSAFTSLKKYSH